MKLPLIVIWAVSIPLWAQVKNPTALNPQCKLFSAAELSKYVKVALGAPENATGGCIWHSLEGETDVMLTVVEARYHAEPKLAAGYRALPDTGKRGNVRPEMGGWSASAVEGSTSVGVHVAGPGVKEATAVALLKDALKRVK